VNDVDDRVDAELPHDGGRASGPASLTSDGAIAAFTGKLWSFIIPGFSQWSQTKRLISLIQ
jgi:hypothetical protein